MLSIAVRSNRLSIFANTSPKEAIWRLLALNEMMILSFAIHERYPIVVHLAVYLENGQRVYFNSENAAQRAERPPATTLTSFFSTCASDPFARTLLYSEMPRYYTWNASSKKWLRRKQGQSVDGYPGVFSTDALGRVYTSHLKNDDCFYLRLLLVNVRGSTSFESLRTADGTVCATFREACQQLQLLEHDNHWNQLLRECSCNRIDSQKRIGNGQIPVDTSSGLISIPPFICQFISTKDELITNVYPNIGQIYRNYDWLSARAILAARNTDINDLNWTIQNQIPGELRSYKSIDRVENEDEVINYPVEFLNSLDLPGMPPHHLRLKIGSVIIMLRNLHAPKLCNGTRLIVTKVMNNVIVARILKGAFKGEECPYPRIPLTSTDLPFQFKRIPCFSHGQLYVACSRVGKPSSLFIYAPEKKTKNVVYHAALYWKKNA